MNFIRPELQTQGQRGLNDVEKKSNIYRLPHVKYLSIKRHVQSVSQQKMQISTPYLLYF